VHNRNGKPTSSIDTSHATSCSKTYPSLNPSFRESTAASHSHSKNDRGPRQKYAKNILTILYKGAEPPITAVHADRLDKEGVPAMMPAAILIGSQPGSPSSSINAQLQNLRPLSFPQKTRKFVPQSAFYVFYAFYAWWFYFQ
jgi:hypothetical protein